MEPQTLSFNPNDQNSLIEACRKIEEDNAVMNADYSDRDARDRTAEFKTTDDSIFAAASANNNQTSIGSSQHQRNYRQM